MLFSQAFNGVGPSFRLQVVVLCFLQSCLYGLFITDNSYAVVFVCLLNCFYSVSISRFLKRWHINVLMKISLTVKKIMRLGYFALTVDFKITFV